MSVKLHALLGDYPNTLALKKGQVSSAMVQFDFADVKVPHDAFKRVVKGEFDVAELAIMTYLQAKAYGRLLVALPVVLHGRFQHGQIVYNSDKGKLAPADLPGRKVGMRTYSQTTPTWVRGVLQGEYGVDFSKVNCITFDDGHVPEFRDPPNAQRAPAGKKMLDMLLAGEIDAAVMAADAKYPQLKTLIPDPKAAAELWYKKNGVLQVNHIFVVQESLAKSNPDAVREIYRLFVESKKASTEAPPADGVDKRPIGIAANRKNFDAAAQCAWQQHIIPKHLSVDDLFDDTTRELGK